VGHKLGPPDRPLVGGKWKVWDPGNGAMWRIYHRDPRTPHALHRRTFGPISRFDPHRATSSGDRQEDPESRAATYLGADIATAGAEVFWDDSPGPDIPARVCPRHWAAQLRTTAPIRLLDLVAENGFDEIGALPELATGASDAREVTQEWGVAIYEDLEAPGIWYPGAHQLGDCLVLFDTAPPLQFVFDGGLPRDRAIQSPGMWRRFKSAYTRGHRRRVEPISSDECHRCQELGLPVLPVRADLHRP